MKSVLISIQPKWCELIASGKKTVEVRKTKPKFDVPFKVYIYETKDKAFENIGIHYADDRKDFIHHTGKVIGEFVCDDIDTIAVFNNILYCVKNSQANKLKQMCLTIDKIKEYLGSKNKGYNWHISDLVIYDNPKELSEFKRSCPDNVYSCAMCRHGDYTGMKCTPFTRPPQNWCYVESVDSNA